MKINYQLNIFLRKKIFLRLILLILLTQIKVLLIADTVASIKKEALVKTEDNLNNWNDVLNLFFKENLKIKSLRLKTASEKLLSDGAGTWKDPLFEISFKDVPSNFSNVPFMSSVQQEIAIPSRLKLEKNEAILKTDLAKFDEKFETYVLLSALKQSYIKYTWAYKIDRIIENNIALLKDIEKILHIKYESGNGMIADILKIQDAKLRLENERLDMNREKKMSELELNILLNRPYDMKFGDLVQLLPMQMPQEKDIIELVIKEKPDLKKMHTMNKMLENDLSMIKTERLPEFMVNASYMINPKEMDMWSAGVMIKIPIWSKRYTNSKRNSILYEKNSVSTLIEFEEKNLEHMTRATLLKIETAKRHIELHEKSLFPISVKMLELDKVAYQSGELPLSDLLNTVQMIRMHHMERENYIKEYGLALSEIESWVGELKGSEQ